MSTYAERAHQALAEKGIEHSYENTGGGTMVTVLYHLSGYSRKRCALVIGEDEPTAWMFTLDAWQNGGEPYTEVDGHLPYDAEDEDVFQAVLRTVENVAAYCHTFTPAAA